MVLTFYRLNSPVGRASTFRGRGLGSGPHHTKGVINGISSSHAVTRSKGVVQQGRHPVFKSGPVEEVIECEGAREGIEWSVEWSFYAFGTSFQSFWSRSFARKDISCHARNQMLDKIVFRQSRFFYLFSTACFFHIISSMSPQVLESTFSTDPWWYLKESSFRKDIHLV